MIFLIDPETAYGDYAESYQRWHHYYNKESEKIQECFKDSVFRPFVSTDSEEVYLNWDKLIGDVEKH